MSRALQCCSCARPFGYVFLAAVLVTGVACNRHEVTNTMSSQSVAEGQATAGRTGAVAPAAAPGMAASEGSNSGPRGAMGGTSGAAVGMAGTGGSASVVHVAMKTPGGAESATQVASAMTILGKLHQTDLKEIEMGKLAEKEANSKEVKSYASTLVRDHEAADKRIMAFAKVEHIDLTAGEKPHNMAAMKPEAGAGFDAAFASEMLHDHQRDIADVKDVRDSTKDPKLKSLLSSLLPVLQKHEEAAQKIVDHMGAKQK